MGLKRKLMEFFGDDIEDDDDELSEELSNDERKETVVEQPSQTQQAKVQPKPAVNRVEQEKQPEEKKGIGSLFGVGKKEEITKMASSKVSYVSIIRPKVFEDSRLIADAIKENKVVTLEYKVYDADTKELLEDTTELGPYFYIQGMGQFLPKIEAALDGKSKGHKLKIEIPMDEAYGDYDEELVEELTKADFADFDDIYEGMEFVVELEDGTEMIAVITEIDGDKVYTDSNHPFSGRNLLFEVEVADVREATDEELDHGHVHFHGFEDDEE